jgi:hypothetical protein
MIDLHFEYDLLTFDNRGFGYSSPSTKCFHSVIDSGLVEERMADLAGVMSTKEDVDDGLWVRLAAVKAKGELCAKQSGGDADIRWHMTTAYAERDMLEILKGFPEHGRKIPMRKFLSLMELWLGKLSLACTLSMSLGLPLMELVMRGLGRKMADVASYWN